MKNLTWRMGLDSPLLVSLTAAAASANQISWSEEVRSIRSINRRWSDPDSLPEAGDVLSGRRRRPSGRRRPVLYQVLSGGAAATFRPRVNNRRLTPPAVQKELNNMSWWTAADFHIQHLQSDAIVCSNCRMKKQSRVSISPEDTDSLETHPEI